MTPINTHLRAPIQLPASADLPPIYAELAAELGDPTATGEGL